MVMMRIKWDRACAVLSMVSAVREVLHKHLLVLWLAVPLSIWHSVWNAVGIQEMFVELNHNWDSLVLMLLGKQAVRTVSDTEYQSLCVEH